MKQSTLPLTSSLNKIPNFPLKKPTLRNCFHLPHPRLIFFSISFNNFDKADILLYRCYVDDTFCVFNNEQDAMSFFEFINTQHPNIKFTFEKQNDDKLSFLDILAFRKFSNKHAACIVLYRFFGGALSQQLNAE